MGKDHFDLWKHQLSYLLDRFSGVYKCVDWDDFMPKSPSYAGNMSKIAGRNTTEHFTIPLSLMICPKCASQYKRFFMMLLSIYILQQPYVTKQMNPS